MIIYRADVEESSYTGRRDWLNSRKVFDGLAHVQPDRTFEARSPERETAQERLRIFLPWGTDVDSADRIRFEGRTYEVDGSPMHWNYGSIRHVRVRAWRVEH
ncbi:head-tail adaptor protein [Streptomyces chattanoogensis]|uniref:head-tail adaptor protein n=1 Tax=Streptomyces chattanoogensis TaxID=66876 RepID=UPI00368019CC